MLPCLQHCFRKPLGDCLSNTEEQCMVTFFRRDPLQSSFVINQTVISLVCYIMYLMGGSMGVLVVVVLHSLSFIMNEWKVFKGSRPVKLRNAKGKGKIFFLTIG